MITPRRTRLLRVPDLQSFHRAIARVACRGDATGIRACAVIVPTRAAAAQLRRTLEDLLLDGARASVMVLPELLTRDEWYARMHERTSGAPPLLREFERHVLARAAAREATEAGTAPPFTLRPSLVAELVNLYDELQRHRCSIDDFDRRMVGELEPSAESDRGAERMLQQTRFVVATFRGYEARVADSGLLDEHTLRDWLIRTEASDGFRQIVVTVSDRTADPTGLWPADFDLLTRLPGLEQIDVIITETLLAAGLHERVHDVLPGCEEERMADPPAGVPVLVAPPEEKGALHFVSRDREEELAAVVRSLKATRGPLLERRAGVDDRTAVVFQRPLPYLYLARQVFGQAGIPYQAQDALPLAAEPYAAALDLVCSVVTGGYTRAALVELLRTPHLAFTVGDRRISPREVAALDRRLQQARYLGDREQLARLADEWSREAGRPDPAADISLVARAARAAAGVSDELQPLEQRRPASDLLRVLLAFVSAHEVIPHADDPLHERHLRARAAILGALERLREAHRRFDDAACEFVEVVSTVRRWIEQQTFSPRTGTGGVQLVDTQAARYGLFADVRIVGLVEGEWPERPRRNIFFPPTLLKQLGWPADVDRLRGARAAFHDLLRAPTDRVSLSSFTLEDDAIVGTSVFLEDLAEAGLPVVHEPDVARLRVSVDDALAEDPVVPDAVTGEAAAWLAARAGRATPSAPQFHGVTGARRPIRYAVSAVEQYLDCPFKYFAGHVLRLQEEPEEEFMMTPRARGRFVHEVFRRFFDRWQQSGHGAIRPDTVDVALAEFTRVADDALGEVPELDRAVERIRLLGSAAAPGLAERVFRLEAERPMDVVERLLEYELAGPFELAGEAGRRRVELRGLADRIDLLADGTLRVIDYKLGRSPRPSRAVQLAIYAVCAEQRLAGRHGREWRVGDAGYVAFGEPRPFISIAGRAGGLEHDLAEGQARFLGAVAQIERGDFPPRPAEPYLCSHCSYPSVCRKDYVRDE